MALNKIRKDLSNDIEKLFKRVDKPIDLPDQKKEPREWKPPDDNKVYTTFGSSAGAGSGEFHVYRKLMRREKERQEYLDAMEAKKLEQVQRKQIEQRRNTKVETKTSKARAKRLQKRGKALNKQSQAKETVVEASHTTATSDNGKRPLEIDAVSTVADTQKKAKLKIIDSP